MTMTGRFSGTVMDSTGAALPGAAVTITNQGTGLSRTVTTDARGFYVITDLPVGTYNVAAEQKSFGRETKTGFRMDPDARVTVDFTLKPGAVTETVEVQATGETVNTTSGEMSRVIDKQQVQDLALNGRNYMQLVSLVPGVALVDEDQMAVTTSLSATNQSINGYRTDQNLLTIDGGYDLDSGSNGSQINNVGVDFIQEVSIKTSNFSAEYGRSAGAQINVVTRSGGNRFHGGAFEFLRNDKVDATNYFSPVKQKLRFNDYGWDLGGPIKRNKLFFFAGEEWKSIRQTVSPNVTSIPTTAQLKGNFTAPGALPKGTTTLKTPANVPAGCTITNNVMSPQCITPNGQAIVNLFTALQQQAVLFTDSPVGNNITFQPSSPFDSREDIARVDYRFSDRHSVYFRYIHDNFMLTLPFGFSCASNFPTCPENRQRPGWNYQVAYEWLISPTLVNEASINAAWNGQRIPPVGTSWERSTYGFTFPQVFANGGGRFRNSIPDITTNGFGTVVGESHSLLSPTTDITESDTLTWNHGSHTLKTGVVVIRNRKDQNARSLYAGKLTFNPTGNTNSTGSPVADELLGNFQDYQEASDDPIGKFRFTQTHAFVSDNWKIRRNLSLEFGVRYQYMMPTYTQGNNIANFQPNLYDPSQAVTVTPTGSIDTTKGGNPLNGLVVAGQGVPAGFYQAKNLFAPRFGFAYSPFGDDKTSIRGGFGMFYDTPEGNTIFPLLSNPPLIQSVDFTSGNLSNPAGGKSPAAAVQGGISAIDRNLQWAYTMSYSLSVQRELPAGVFLELAYVGNEDRHLIRKPDINQPDFAALAAKAPPTGTTAISSGVVNSLRPFKGFSAINTFISDSGGNYNGLQAYVTKRKGNLTLTAGYTWSKAMTDSTSITDTSSDNVLAFTNRRYDYGPATFDRTNIFVTTYNYNIPFFRGRGGIVGQTLGGWEFSGITRAQSGEPFTVRGANGLGTVRADQVGDPNSGSCANGSPVHTVSCWFNTSAYVVAPVTRLGTAGVGSVRGPGLYTWDLSLRKEFPIVHEDWRLRFQADMFNAFNHPNFRFDSITSLTPNNTTVTNNSYGTITAAGPPRQIQFGLKFTF
jgi:hypothetical protein